MRETYRWSGLVAVAILTAALVACRPPTSPDDDTDDDGWTVDDDIGTDGEENRDVWDAPPSGDLTVKAGRMVSGGTQFEPYDEQAPEFEVVRGFQGGFHLEPALLIYGTDRTDITANLNYVVERTSNGQQITRPTELEIGPRGWTQMQGGWVHRGDRVIFDLAEPSDVTGDEVELRITVNVQAGGLASETYVGTVVDEERR